MWLGALRSEELVERVFCIENKHLDMMSCIAGRTVDGPLVRAIVADTLTRAVAPVAALDATCTRKVPAAVSRCRVYIHDAVQALREWCGRLRVWSGDGAKAGDGEGRIIDVPLTLEAHVYDKLLEEEKWCEARSTACGVKERGKMGRDGWLMMQHAAEAGRGRGACRVTTIATALSANRRLLPHSPVPLPSNVDSTAIKVTIPTVFLKSASVAVLPETCSALISCEAGDMHSVRKPRKSQCHTRLIV
jgi:hypothetical protein